MSDTPPAPDRGPNEWEVGPDDWRYQNDPSVGPADPHPADPHAVTFEAFARYVLEVAGMLLLLPVCLTVVAVIGITFRAHGAPAWLSAALAVLVPALVSGLLGTAWFGAAGLLGALRRRASVTVTTTGADR
jgi:hypothetical protein